MNNNNRDENFRSDINGLRAWAVVAVVGYHFGVFAFSGGFVGVDIFFVISGYLMTSIILRGLEQGTFSYGRFYVARAKRIVPSLLFLCAALITLGWIFLLPPDYKQLASHSIYSILFLSNVEFWRESGYFDVASHQKWLLHTWSLSVEWQFYLLLPVLLGVVWKIRASLRLQLVVIVACLMLSYSMAIWLTHKDPAGAFYLLPTRAWQMLSGGALFIIAKTNPFSERLKSAMEIAGLVIITACVVLFSRHTVWPGWLAACPVAGALLVIAANGSSPLTTGTIANWIGTRSYSIYLWHWPIYVGLAYVELQHSLIAVALAVILTFVVGHLAYTYVESVSRIKLYAHGPLPSVLAITALAGLCALPEVFIWSHGGIGSRFSPLAEQAAAESSNINPRKTKCHLNSGIVSPSCTYGNGDKRVLVVGDSHADAIVSSVAAAGASVGVSATQWTYSGCPVVTGVRKVPEEAARLSANYHCTEFVDWVNTQAGLQDSAIPVIILNRYALAAMGPNESPEEGNAPRVYFTNVHLNPDAAFLKEFGASLTRSACAMAKQRAVYLMRPVPEMGVDVPRAVSRRLAIGVSRDISISMEDYRQRNSWVWEAQDAARDQCGVKILDTTKYLCRDGRCYGSINGRPLYVDDNHLSEYGNKLLLPMFKDMFSTVFTK